uniref:STAS domain-containing protein n=1 Tax=Meloidogyne enterolobii TaxID=390850 RepID=A0A6V7VIN2_MELEN|nr:unnamed protein product [Meloidogyne enterolobii]
MDSSNQHLLGGIRRAPMNQDEFDTKFNFSSERKTKQRRYSLDSIVENQPQAVANDLCGGALLCWRRAIYLHSCSSQIPPQQPQQRQKPSRQHISLASAHSGSGGVSNLPLPRYQLSNADEGDHLWSSKHCPTTHLPIIRVLQRYSFRKDLFGDFRAGLALSLHGTAEGLAMAFLAGLPPICGLYTTFYSSLVYLFFGTSNFSFMGTNLAVCFFLGNIIERNTTVEGSNIISYGPLEVASTAIILCAIVNSAIYLFRLDFLFGLFSEQIIAGFSFGLGTRIVFSQLGNIIQLKSNRICEGDQLTIKQASIAIASNSIPATTTSFPCILWAYYRRLNVPNNSKKTSFNLINQTLINQNLSSSFLNSTKIIKNNIIESENNCLPSIWECFDAINLNTLAASLLCIFLIIFTRQIIGPLTRFRLRSAISSEFLLIILGSLLSNILNIKTKWQLDTINFSESKLFLLSLPSRSLISQLFTDSIGLAFFVFVLHLRSANLLSKTNKYKIDERQELISLNLINLLSTFVSAIPPGHSPLRTSIGTRAGAKTILANISLVLSLIPIIIWSSKLFQSLPICVLSCILLTEICPMFTGISKLPLLWEISRLDVLSFVFSALMALFSSNLSQALFVSVILSAGTIIVRAQWPRLQQLTNVTGSGAYYAERCYYGGSDLMDEAGVSVVRFEAPILFHNSSYFKACIRESAAKIKGQLLGIGIGTRTGSMKSMKSTNAQIVSGSIHNKDSIQMRSTLLISGDFVPNLENPGGAVLESNNNNLITKVLIIDFSSVPYIDGQAI